MSVGIASKRNIHTLAKVATKSAHLWGLTGSLELLGQSENLVYKISGFILRLTENSHRTATELNAELDFIAALSDQNVSVAMPKLSLSGLLVETVDGYHISVFKIAKGIVKKASEAFSSLDTAFSLGCELGKMHSLSVSYSPQSDKRHQYADITYHKEGLNFIPAVDYLAVEEFKKAMNWVKSLPKIDDAYGLVHMDAHAGNFCIDDKDKVTLFDFDDCAYNFFSYDLAVPINSLQASDLSDDQKQSARESLLSGYAGEYTMPEEWLDLINGFIRFRHIEMFAWRCMMFGAPTSNDGRVDFVDFYKLSEDFTKPYPELRIKDWF